MNIKNLYMVEKNCLAAYADKFRIILQSKNLGWWFDLDVICLKNKKNSVN